MINDLLILTRNTPLKTFTDSYLLNNGMYFLFDKEGNLLEEHLKNNKEIDVWESKFKEKAFFSMNLNANKALILNPLSLKAIQSVNIFSFITWQSFFVDKDFLNEAISAYLRELLALVKDDKELLKLYDDFKEVLTSCIMYVHEHVFDYFKVVDKNGNVSNGDISKNKILIFIDLPVDLYEYAFKAYAKEKIFLSEAYNINIDGETLGVPTNFNTYNSKKPFLMHYTQSNIINYQDSFENVYNIYKLHKWLISKAFIQLPIRISCEDNVLKIQERTKPHYLINGEIKRSTLGTEFIPSRFELINPNRNSLIISNENFMEFKLGKREISVISSWEEFEGYLNQKIFFNYLYKINDLKIGDRISGNLINILKSYGSICINAIKYQDIALLKKVIPELISKILVQKCNIAIKDSSSEISYIFDIMELLLFKYNFLSSKNIDYTGGRKMKNKMIDIQSIIYDKIDGNDICVCNNIDEYCFAVGQLARYMINQNAGKNVTFKEFSPLLNCKDCLSLSKALDNLMKKYDHALRLRFNALNNLILLTHGNEFNSNDKINSDMLLCGFVAENRLYKKNKEDLDNE